MEVKAGYKQTEVGVIPEVWDVPHLRLHLLQDATYGVVKAGTFQRVGIPMLRGGDIKAGAIAADQPLITSEKSNEYARTVLKERDVVIALVGYPGESAVVPARLAGANISRAVGLLRPAKTLLPEFLACYLNSPSGRKEFLRPSAGSAQIVVNLGALNHLRLPLPSETEQHAIAAALSDVDALLGGLDRLIAKKRDLKQAAMQQLLTGQTRLPGFSGEWEVKRVLELGDVVTGGTPRTDVAEFWGDEYPWVTPTDISTRRDMFSSDRWLTKKGLDAVRVLPPNTVLVTCIASIGKNAILRTTGACNQQINAVIPNRSSDAGFLYYLFEASKQYLLANAGITATSIISKAAFSELTFRAPLLEEQVAIAVVLSDMDAELAALEARRDKTRDLKQAMMQELLTGKTRLVKPEAAHA